MSGFYLICLITGVVYAADYEVQIHSGNIVGDEYDRQSFVAILGNTSETKQIQMFTSTGSNTPNFARGTAVSVKVTDNVDLRSLCGVKIWKRNNNDLWFIQTIKVTHLQRRIGKTFNVHRAVPNYNINEPLQFIAEVKTNLGEWGEWSCCDGVSQSRVRTCHHTPPECSARGESCPLTEEMRTCTNCPVEGIWSNWIERDGCKTETSAKRRKYCMYNTSHFNNVPCTGDDGDEDTQSCFVSQSILETISTQVSNTIVQDNCSSIADENKVDKSVVISIGIVLGVSLALNLLLCLFLTVVLRDLFCFKKDKIHSTDST